MVQPGVQPLNSYNMIQLRPYQEAAVRQMRESIRQGKTRMILCAPTGAGKTVIFSYMAHSAVQRGRSVLIVTDRIELLKQSGGALNRLGIIPYEIKAGHEPATLSGQIYVAMVETLARRMKDARYQRLVSGFDAIIFDEAHKQAFNKLFEYVSPDTVVIGATATPYRDKNQESLDKFYQDLIEVTTIPELVAEGFLARPLSYGVPVDLSQVQMRAGEFDEVSMGREYSRNKVYAGVIENYQRLTPGRKALAFAASIESSKELVERMVDEGINAKHLDSNMSPYDRGRILGWFRRTPDAVLSNVGILTTGFDAPEVEVVILYRATTSLPLFLQMVGRGSRPAPGKDQFHILDFGENIHRHGFWEQEREWSLSKPKKRRKGDSAAPVKDCPDCGALLHLSARVCACGHEFTPSDKEKKEKAFAQLTLLSPSERRRIAAGVSLREKAEMAKAGVVKPFWVLHQLRSQDEAKEFVEHMGWKWKGWWYYNRHRFPNLQNQNQTA